MKKLIIGSLIFLSINAVASIADINTAQQRANQQFAQQAQNSWKAPFDIINEFNRNPNELPICASYIEPNGKKSETKKLIGLRTTGSLINNVERCMNCFPDGDYIALNLGSMIHYVKVNAVKKYYIGGSDRYGNKWKLIVSENCRY